jgi:putative peptidoglycan lipid II flippase
VRLYAGDFALVPGKIELTVRLTRIMLPFLTLVALAAAAMGMLNALGHYFMPALAPAAFNVASIGSAILLTPVMIGLGLPPVTAIAIGAVIGGVGQLALQWPSLRREGFRYRPAMDLTDPGLRQVLLLMGPGTLGLAATQVNLFVSTLLAARQGPGAVSWLQYGFRLLYLPIGLFGVSIATAVLPAVSRHLATDNKAAVSRTVTRGISLMLLVNIPATVGLVVLAEPIVRLLLERGHFTSTDTHATAAAVQCYAVGLLGYSAARIASPIFYALGRSRVAVAISTVSVVTNLGLSLVLTASLGYRGLALATSLAATINGGLAVVLLHRHLRALNVGHLVATAAKTAAAAALMAATLYLIVPPMSALLPSSGFIGQAVRLFVEIAAGIAVFGGVAILFKIPELETVLGTVLGRRSVPLDR